MAPLKLFLPEAQPSLNSVGPWTVRILRPDFVDLQRTPDHGTVVYRSPDFIFR